MSTLSERVKERMQAMGLNNAQLAAACKVKPPTSFNWASGKTKAIKGEPLLKAAKALGVTPDWLATGKGKAIYDDSAPAASERSPLAYLPDPPRDKNETELLALFHLLDDDGKKELLAYTKGFVMGRRPHQDGQALQMAG